MYLGPFASPARMVQLSEASITHVLNVGEAPSVLATGRDAIREVAWHPIVDLERIPFETAITCLETLHRMVCVPESRVYVHCVAGWNRSPTVVWLYLVACGIEKATARKLIERNAPDAVPCHSKLIDDTLVEAVRRHGKAHFLPHRRPKAIAGI
ncbi:MAG: hypothetical protein DWQ37_14600 [Planctomycetota bacterium]|nr:MAG: hypothetical protein DWQ37_14600 [Planctomycetota bacterium]